MRLAAHIVFVVLGVVGSFAFQGLSGIHGIPGLSIILFLVLTFVSVVIHEAGHALMVVLTGGILIGVVVYPFRFSPTSGEFGLADFQRSGEVGGFVEYEPREKTGLRSEILVALAGPGANAILTTICYVAASG